MSKILFNASGSSIGGAVKNAAQFIQYSVVDQEINWYYAVTNEIYNELNGLGNNIKDRIFIFDKSPSRNRAQRKRLLSLIDQLDIDAVYTMAGPAYVTFNRLHFMGISNPYVTHAGWDVINLKYSFVSKLEKIITTVYQAYFSIKADHFFFQTEQSRNGFCRRFKRSRHITHIVENAFDHKLMNQSETVCGINPEQTIHFFCPAATYSHKAIQFIPAIVSEIKKKEPALKVKFVITVDENSRLFQEIKKNIERYNVHTEIVNIGRFKYSQVEKLYSNCHFVFVPSLLETYSASYLEAMVFQKPLIAADKVFAREVCKEAAHYINPLNSIESAKSLIKLIYNKEDRMRLVEAGKLVVREKINQEQRYYKIKNIILEHIN